MIRLARAGIEEYRHWQAFTGLADPRAHFHNDGVLWFTGVDPHWADRESARLQRLGVRSAVLDDSDLAKRFPAINPCTAPVDLDNPDAHRCHGEGRHLLELDGGYMDPVHAAGDLLTACRGAGVTVLFNAAVATVRSRGGRVSGVRLADGRDIGTDVVVNAAGPWCNAVYAAAGLEAPMPLTPVRIQVVYVDRSATVEGPIPVCADLQSGIYFRAQNRGQQLIVSSVREEDERETVADPDDFLTVADDQFRLEKLHLLQHRLRGLTLSGTIRDYCGLYTVNQTDVHPVVGAYGPTGFFIANGFSGHGFKTAPAIGGMLARLITGDTLPGEDSRDDGWLAPQRTPIEIATRSVLA